jgi:DNA-directed RNA polymerase specialized sigma24 family protein
VRHALDVGKYMMNDLLVVKKSQGAPAVFDVRFSRCYRLLHFLACRILGDPEAAEDAVEICRLAASRNPPQFEYESAFRSWLVRVLINEALALLCDNEGIAAGKPLLRMMKSDRVTEET